LNYSYAYDELIEEVEADLKEGLLQVEDMVKIVRSDKVVYQDYRPILDYYYPDDEPEETCEEMQILLMLEEMRYHDQIIK